MKSKIKLALASLVCMVGFVALAPALMPVSDAIAQTGGAQGGLDAVAGAFPEGAKKDVNVTALVKRIIEWALYLAAVAAVLFIIYGGFLYITSGGDAGQAGKGKTALINAIIGLVVVVLSFMIVQVVYNFLIGAGPTT